MSLSKLVEKRLFESREIYPVGTLYKSQDKYFQITSWDGQRDATKTYYGIPHNPSRQEKFLLRYRNIVVMR